MGAWVGIMVAQGGQWGLLVCPPRYRCPLLLFSLSLLLNLASTLSLQPVCAAQPVAGSDAPLSLSHQELSPSPPASPLPFYKHHGPWLLGAATSKGFSASSLCLLPVAPQPLPGSHQGSTALAAHNMGRVLLGPQYAVGRVRLWLMVSTELEERKWLLKSLTSSLLLLRRSRRLLAPGTGLRSPSPPAAPAREGAALVQHQQHRRVGTLPMGAVSLTLPLVSWCT